MKNAFRDQDGGGMSWKHVQDWADGHPVPSLVLGGVAAAIVLAALGLLAWKLHGRDRSVKVRGLVALGTLMATMVQASGMWHFFGDVMHMSVAYKIVMFPFLEILILAFGLKALEKAEEAGNWLIYAVMLWILALSSGGMSASDSSGLREGLFRLLVAVVIAVLWTLDLLDLWLKARKKKAELEGRPLEKVRWRFTPRELGIRLGLASADDSTLSDLDANRHFERYLRVSDRLRMLKEHNAKATAIHRTAVREAKAKAKLQRHARLHADPSALMDALGAQAVADAQARLGIDEAQSELRQAHKRAEEHATEVERLNTLLATERDAATAAAQAATAQIDQLTALRAELEAARARTAETDLELERVQQLRRQLTSELDIERRERTDEAAEARRRIAALEHELEQLRSAPPGAAIPGQRPAPTAASVPTPIPAALPIPTPTPARATPPPAIQPPADPEQPPTSTTPGRQSPKQMVYQAADQLTDQGTNTDHPLLSDHGPTRSEAVRELADRLGYKETTVHKYAKAYLEERNPSGVSR